MPAKQLVNWKVLMLWIAAAALMSWALRVVATGSNAQWTVSIVIGALILSSVVAEIETRMTGKPSAKKVKPRR
jgi:hypothetical protein